MDRGIELEGVSAQEAFGLLGNETRVDVLRGLWGVDGGDLPTGSDGVLSFSELQRRVGVGNSGQFTYHLSQLVPHFVRETDEGYRLSRAGTENRTDGRLAE